MRAVTAPPSLDLTLGTSASLFLLHNSWQQYCTLYYTIVLLCVVLFSSDMHAQAWLKLFLQDFFLNNPFFNLFLYNVIFS